VSEAATDSGPMAVRRAGLLLHVTSLPGGVIGPEAHALVDLLADAGVTVWQVLPLVPPKEPGASPYSATSSMAGNPALIDRSVAPPDPSGPEYDDWLARQADWLEPYAEFTALRMLHGAAPWTTWAPGLRDRDPRRVREALAGAGDLIERLRAEQWTFAEQWRLLQEHAAERGVVVFGDLPIFVGHDSAEVWSQRRLFLLDEEGRPITVTGVPPDYFAVDGQRWDNPHYDWDAMAADGYAWWRRRIGRQRELFDLVRIDHFRGFEAAWHVPADAPTARDGWWVPGPGSAVVDALVDAAGPGTLVAEDLGVITPEVEALRLDAGLPGMKVLQFAFDGSPDNPHLPAQTGEWSVVYTGTHDNDTTVGWWSVLDESTRAAVRRLLVDPDEPIQWALVRLALASRARLAVVPAQDLLGLGSEARMNTPGREAGAWAWRAEPGALSPDLLARYGALVAAADRRVPAGYI
jgi:4-alpha-glucanotransferase